jgi:hypothetical protein
MLTISKLAVPALSLSSCSAYCSAIPGRHVSAGVARIRAACEAASAAPFGERRAREPVPIPRKERQKRPLCCVLHKSVRPFSDKTG